MNKTIQNGEHNLLLYQSEKVRTLIEEIIQCCQERHLFEIMKFDLNQSELRCLMQFNQEKYLTVKGIACKLDVAKSRVTKIIEGLLEKKMVASTEDPHDARVKLISLTSNGQKKQKEIDDFVRNIHLKILSQMDETKRKEVLSALETLRSSMEAVKMQLK